MGRREEDGDRAGIEGGKYGCLTRPRRIEYRQNVLSPLLPGGHGRKRYTVGGASSSTVKNDQSAERRQSHHEFRGNR